MECEVWLEKSFYEIIKVERWSGRHLKANYGYLESSLDISAFHYLVQTEFSHKTNDGSMAICLYSTFLPQFGGDGRIIQQTKQLTQLDSHQQIIFLHLSLDSSDASDLSSN